MAFSQDLNKDMLFFSTWHAQNAANTLLLELEESTEQQCAKIDNLTRELLELIPAGILDSTGEQLLDVNFDISTLLSYTKENSGIERQGTFDEERSCLTASLTSSQLFDQKGNHSNKQRWKTPIKKHFDSGSKGKNSSNKKGGNIFKANKQQISSGKKLTWRF